MTSSKKLISVGKVVSVYGVKGWVKILSFTEPRENILDYLPWQLIIKDQPHPVKVTDQKVYTDKMIVQLDNCNDRDQARRYVGLDIEIYRDQLPPPSAGEYYWTDLEGMLVTNQQNELLGTVDHVMATGSNDVLVIQGEKRHLVPILMDSVVLNIDFATNTIKVDWDANF